MKELLQRAWRAQEMGNLAEAAQLFSDVLRMDPRNFDAVLSLGLLHFRAARFDDAERFAGEASRLNPGSADAFFIRGCALQRLDRSADALECFDRAVAARPGFVEALVNRGALLMADSRHPEALQSFDAALAINRAMPEAWNNRGNVLSELGRHEEAIASYDKVLAARPNFVEAQINRGTALIALQRFDEALENYDQATRLSPERTDALAGRANALFLMKDYERAAAAYEAVLARDPDYGYVRGNLAFSRLHCCDWSSLEADRSAVARGLFEGRRIVNPFQALALLASPHSLLRCATLWMADKYPRAPTALWPGQRNSDRGKIRVAYLSADFNGHAVATLLAGVWEHHDKSRFETTAISYVPSNGSTMRQRVERAFDRVVDVAGTSDAEAARMIRRLEVDIVVDLMGYTGECRPGILAQRPAPVQVNFLGFPGTMGTSYIDYIIADPIVVPEEQREHFSERVVYLPHSHHPGALRSIAAPNSARGKVGLPDSGFVFCSFNNNYKIAPDVFAIWMRLLAAVPDSVIWLLEDNKAAARNLRHQASSKGIPPERLVFAPRIDQDGHLARHRFADLVLDTLPCNAGATASDALMMGVPVLTTLGKTFVGRIAASILHAAGLPELIAATQADYETLALELARKPEMLGALKEKLARNRGTCPLFDTPRYTRALEEGYVRMWQMQQSGGAPAHFAVGSA